jgi:RHS repeat-associated protein
VFHLVVVRKEGFVRALPGIRLILLCFVTLRLWLGPIPLCSAEVITSHVACDPRGGIWNFGMELIADECVPKDLKDTDSIHYLTIPLTCNQGTKQVESFAAWGDTTNSAVNIIQEALIAPVSNGSAYKIFRNKEGTHILLVHPLYVGLLDDKEMTTYIQGEIYTDVFKRTGDNVERAFILPQIPICRMNDRCQLSGPFGSSVNYGSGSISHSQELFSAKGGQLPLVLSIDYHSNPIAPGSIGNGWSHSYEQTLEIFKNGAVTFWGGGTGRDYRLDKDNRYFAPRDDYSNLSKNSDGGYLLTEKEGITRTFTSSGQLTAITDRNGNTLKIMYENGKVARVFDPAGRTASFAYDLSGKLSILTDPMGNNYLFTYTNGFLTSFTAPDGGTWQYLYGPGGLLTSKTDPNGYSSTYNYDANNRATTATDSRGRFRSVDYSASDIGNSDPNLKVPDPYPVCYSAMINAEGNARDFGNFTPDGACREVTVPFMDKNGANWLNRFDYTSQTLTARIDPYGNSTSFTYDLHANMLSKTEPGIGTTWYGYDTTGNRTSIVDPMGNFTDYTYNAMGQDLTSSGPMGTTNKSYDAKGNLLTGTDVAGAMTTYNYDPWGNITRITNAKNQASVMTYTPEGFLAGSTDPAGVVRRFTYDTFGNLLTATGPEGLTTYRYDRMGRLIGTTDPLGQVSSSTYDKQGNRISQTDANGNTTLYGYNYQGQVAEITDVLGGVTSYAYENGGGCPSCGSGVDTLAGLTDAKSQTTSYSYDLMSRLIKETDPLGKITTYVYDVAGNLKSKSSANGITVSYVYDPLRRLIKKAYSAGSMETYTYDSAGRLLAAENKDVSYGYAYDAAGRLIKATDSRGMVLEYEYDILGARTWMALQKGTTDEHVTTYGYDSANRPLTIGSSSGTFTYGYDLQGRRSSLTYPNGVTANYGYDTMGRLTSLKQTAGTDTITFATYSGFDKVGNRLGKTVPTGTETYSYDPVYRLTLAQTPQGTELFRYDAVGNRLAGPWSKDTGYQYNAANQMVKGRQFGYQYDDNGNQISRILPKFTDKSWVQSWDAENRLIRLEKSKGSTENRTVTFTYDPQGRRIEKKLTTLINGVIKSSRWFYYYDNDNIALEIYINDTGITEKSWYTHGVGVDEHLAVERAGQQYFYHTDGLGSVTAITNGAKNIVQSYIYESFGMLQPSTGFRNSYTYTGREWDKESGLYYYRARYYDALEGRFISRDPIGFEGGINIYGYTSNNSINYKDPSGLDSPGCDVPQWAKSKTEANDCFLKCCAVHDKCYHDHECSYTSWSGNFLGGVVSRIFPCVRCNDAAVLCFARCTTKWKPTNPPGKYYCGKDDFWFDSVVNPHMSHSTDR